MSNLYKSIYNPDVLTCLANLSSDEVFTPPEIANKMLDMLPQELFSNPDTKFLDPACKSGVFLREIAKRLIKGLEPVIPDLQERLDHIYHEQLYGIAITELTSLLSRRSLYCSKYPNGIYSISHFDAIDGNIKFHRIQHTWENGSCKYCGASEKEYKRSKELENHAYDFIHIFNPKELFNMKFDVIISNPPYQLSDGGAQASASPLYNLFVEQSKKLNPRYLTMIIPSRWFAGGKGLDDFRDKMLNDSHLKEIDDFANTDDCFPGVNIRGGVCYFLWDRSYDNKKNLAKIVTHIGKESKECMRPIKYKGLDIFIRYQQAISILEKIKCDGGDNSFMPYVSSRKPIGLGTNFTQESDFKESPNGLKEPIKCYGKGFCVGYVEKKKVPSHIDWCNQWKLMTSRANNIGTELNDDNLNAYICEPECICTESYIIIGANMNLNKESCENIISYLQTKFARFCHSLAKASQDATAKTYRFVPVQDFSKPWTDKELYKKYGLNEEEIAFIESMIKPMDSSREE